MTSITGISALDALARTPPGAPAAGGAVAAGAWFEFASSAGDTALRGEVEPAARGLDVQGHAQRVLACLAGERG